MSTNIIFHSQLTLKNLLVQWQEARLITPLDKHFALHMSALHQEESPLFMLICLLVSQQLSNQHTCLQLSQVNLSNPLNEPQASVSIDGDLASLKSALLSFDAISCIEKSPSNDLADSQEINSPLVLENERLYLQKYHHFETQVFNYLNHIAKRSHQDENDDNEALAQTLTMLFPPQANSEIDWQKVATATAYMQQLSVITGGPGTGKTTTVTKLLYLLCHQHLCSAKANHTNGGNHADLNIKLVAPTGKAAARLSESIKASKARLADTLTAQGANFNQAALNNIPEQASTLHRLLGVIPNSVQFRHHKDNPLRLDLLIIDEASMVDLPMMYSVLSALPENARLILLGDQDQLASVEAGAVLADICQGLKQQDGSWRMRYSFTNATRLSQLTQLNLTSFVDNDKEPNSDTSKSPAHLGDSLCMLTKSHRFKDDAGIGQLAKAVNHSDAQGIREVWQHGYNELLWLEHGINAHLENQAGINLLIKESVKTFSAYLKQIQSGTFEPQAVIEQYNNYRLLCAMRNGEYGVDGINNKVEQALKQAGLIQPSQEFYPGRPIIIGSNDYNLGLFNGDIGLILPDPTREYRPMAYFIQADASVLTILPARLPSHETCYGMTVHKSQGSEFASVALVLPPKPSLAQRQLLTKELIYTAITRAKQKFICLGSVPIFEGASLSATQRASGLAARLWRR